MKLLVLFLFLSALNGGNDNFPQIRSRKTGRYGGQLDVYRFEDAGNVCYVISHNNNSGSPGTGISCVKAAK